MTRNKVKLELIDNESERRVSFQDRKKGVMKELDEITTLCDIDACAIISSPYEANIEVWPSHAELHRVLTRFRNMAPADQTKKMFDLETFTRERINKLTEKVRKLRIDNRQDELEQMINQSFATGYLDYQNDPQLLDEIAQTLRRNILEVNMRIQARKGEYPVQETNTGGMQAGEGSSRQGNIKLEKIPKLENLMASGGEMKTRHGRPGSIKLENITNVENFMGSGGDMQTRHGRTGSIKLENITKVENFMERGGEMQSRDGSNRPQGKIKLENITDVENILESGGGGGGGKRKLISPNDDNAPGFI